MAKFDARLVVVTGAGSGIGRATAEHFAASGATVICADIDPATAGETALRITQHGGQADAHAFDVADPQAWDGFGADVLATHGVADVLVNNAGIGMGGAFLDHTAADWQRLVDVNLLGVVHGCRVFGRQLAQRHVEQPHRHRRRTHLRGGAIRQGHIVNIASAAAFTPSRVLPAYVATKAAVLMLSEALRPEMADHNVGVSAICPGFIATNIYAATTYVGLTGAAAADRASAAGLLGRIAASPDLVARRIAFAVRHDVPVLPVTVGAWLSYAAFHLATPLHRRAMRLGSAAQLSTAENWAVEKFGKRSTRTADVPTRDETRTP